MVLADLMGRISFVFVDKHRDTAIGNLNAVFSDDPKKCEKIARDVFRNLAKSTVDWIRLARYSRQDLLGLVTEAEGMEHLDKVLAKGKGVVALGSHFGNWELFPLYLRVLGYKGAVVARRLYFYKYDKFITRLRNRFGVQVIYRDESPKRFLRVLRDGGILGIIADQDVDSIEGVFVDFFGRPAYTPTAPVKLAMAAGTDIVPGFMVRKPDNTYKLVLEEPIELLPSGDKQEDIKRYTQAWTDVLEKYIRKYPDQWVWVHKRWKTQGTS